MGSSLPQDGAARRGPSRGSTHFCSPNQALTIGLGDGTERAPGWPRIGNGPAAATAPKDASRRGREAARHHELEETMSAAEVLKLIKEKGVKFVDLRLTDTRGKEQHVTVPASTVDESFFEDGKMFDGSSIAGWKGINESDMILLPDTATAVLAVL